MADTNRRLGRRGFLIDAARVSGVVAIAGTGALALDRSRHREEYVWQLDPDKCIGCGNCATHCVLDESAVKAVQFFSMCAMCDPCPGYFDLGHIHRDTGAENQLCPTGAIARTLIAVQSGVRRYEYPVTESLCIGCGKCVAGCAMMNGSLYLQVRHDRCLNCNQCSIAVACPTQAFERVPSSDPYLLKKKAREIRKQKDRTA
ncbi:MAG: 4Fe-4S binding protein [Thermoguttaceae bacterium]